MNSVKIIGENLDTKKKESSVLLGSSELQPLAFWTVQETPWEIFRKILILSSLMIFLPLGLYFLSKAVVFEAILGMSATNSYFYSAIVAIVATHAVLVVFIFFALRDGSEAPKRKLH